jgi:hypothetical protein
MKPTMIRAFGKYKSTNAWVQDKRCKVSANILLRRIHRGMKVEDAISTPPQAMIHAFGEWKTRNAWANDKRCKVTRETLLNRLQSGMNMEDAMLTPPQGEMIHAFGKSKSFDAWANDKHCKVSAQTLRRRIQSGMNPEDAIRTPPQKINTPILIHAYGEWNSATAWSHDKRCKISTSTLLKRIQDGMSDEDAVRTPTRVPPRILTAWGEPKRLTEWSRDERCGVSLATLYRRVTFEGMTPQEAMETPLGGFKLFHALGESKSKADWLNDDRCLITNTTIYRRMAKGMTFEEAITTPDVELIPAFGEWKGVTAWSNDGRCVVSFKVLWNRLQVGWPPEEAMQSIKLPYRRKIPYGKLTYAFGEWKSKIDWFNDDRCPLENSITLYQRLSRLDKNDMSVEEAITTPVGEAPNTTNKIILEPGQKYYLLTFMHMLESWDVYGRQLALWQCECERTHMAPVAAVTSGNCKSCGCLHKEWLKTFTQKYRNGSEWKNNNKKLVIAIRAPQMFNNLKEQA